MTPLSLLESARQGNPTAIAALMNLTLNPKGITAKAALKEQCLHVFLSSDRALNQATLVSFTRHGVVGLGLEVLQESIQLVKVYGQKSDEASPLWTDAFTLTSVLPDHPPTHPLQATDPLQADVDVLQSELASDRSRPGLTVANQLTQWFIASKQHIANGLGSDRPRRMLMLTNDYTKRLAHQFTASKQKIAETLDRVQFPIWQAAILQSQPLSSSKSLTTAAIVTVVAFMSGGFLAVIASSHNEAASKTDRINLFAKAADSQASIQPTAEQIITNQQVETQKYLLKMNAAQRKFYLENNRLASSLEDL